MMSYSVKQNSHFPVENDLMLKGTGKEIRTMLQKKINRELTVFLNIPFLKAWVRRALNHKEILKIKQQKQATAF